MGCAVSKDKEATERSKKIDQILRGDAEKLNSEVKLLLLGKYYKYHGIFNEMRVKIN